MGETKKGVGLELESPWGGSYQLELVRDTYESDGSLAVTAYMCGPDDMVGEPYASVTANIGDGAPTDEATAYLDPNMGDALRAAVGKLGKPTGHVGMSASGFESFEQFAFDAATLADMRDFDGYASAMRDRQAGVTEQETKPSPAESAKVARRAAAMTAQQGGDSLGQAARL